MDFNTKPQEPPSSIPLANRPDNGIGLASPETMDVEVASTATSKNSMSAFEVVNTPPLLLKSMGHQDSLNYTTGSNSRCLPSSKPERATWQTAEERGESITWTRVAFRNLTVGTVIILVIVISLHGLGTGCFPSDPWANHRASVSVGSDKRLTNRFRSVNDGSIGTHKEHVPDNIDFSRRRDLEGEGGGPSLWTDGKAASSRRAKIAYLVMTSGMDEIQKTKRLLKAIYHPTNLYLIHLDRKSGDDARRELEAFIAGWPNVRMLVPALDVSWGGYTVTLTAIFGICTMVQWSSDWDFFINLSASDFPLLTQDELMGVLGRYADAGLNFVSGEPLNERNRVEVFIDDQGLYREVQTFMAGRPLKVGKPRLPPSKSMFTVYKGEFWVILHRSFCRYLEASPDNVARSLQAYFSKFRISDESYFQTVLCHPQAPSFPIFADNMRFVSWPVVSEGYYVLHPDPISGSNVISAMESGAIFARKFDLQVSREAYQILEESLSTHDPERLRRSAERLAPAMQIHGRKRFCEIPKDYSIQKVLSRPPKTAQQHEASTDAGDSKAQQPETVHATSNASPQLTGDIGGYYNNP